MRQEGLDKSKASKTRAISDNVTGLFVTILSIAVLTRAEEHGCQRMGLISEENNDHKDDQVQGQDHLDPRLLPFHLS
jgi:hypothetical protein